MAIEEQDRIKKMIQDNQTVETHSPKDLIALDEYNQKKINSKRSKTFGMRSMRLSTPGSV